MTANGIQKEGLRPRRSYQRLSERLRLFMAEGHFQSGDRLPPERTLAENFGVSRSSIRKAIQMLADKGLLESRQGDGTYVRAPDMESLKKAILEAVDSENLIFDEIMEFRKIIEPAIAELAAVRHCEAAREMRMKRTRNENVPEHFFCFGTFFVLSAVINRSCG